jgi:hypothetical protein
VAISRDFLLAAALLQNAHYGLKPSGPRAIPPPVESPAAAAVAGVGAVEQTPRAGRETAVRVDSQRWHLAACWRALESVADELGDPPRATRYAELAGARDDLPSPPTLRARLGPWSGIAAALVEQQAARGRGPQGPANRLGTTAEPANRLRATKESIETERLPTQVEVDVLRHLAAHPGSSGTEVRNGAGIRSASQTWTLLARLEREGLLVNEAGGQGKARKNAWRLSKRGRNVLSGLPEGMYAA